MQQERDCTGSSQTMTSKAARRSSRARRRERSSTALGSGRNLRNGRRFARAESFYARTAAGIQPDVRPILLAVALSACTAPEPLIPIDPIDPIDCTADTATDPNHCGACGHVCPHVPGAVAQCEAGACGFRCEAGRADCNGDDSDGCEVEPATDPNHCGDCSSRCEVAGPNVVAVCVESTCGATCEESFGDCNFDRDDGCEIDLRSDASHCGFCSNACTTECIGAICVGDTAPCVFHSNEAPRPVSVEVASDGDGFLVAWTDFENEGLWIAPLDRFGRPSGEAVRVADMKSWWRFGLGFDGSSFVVAWEDEDAPQVLARRYASDAAAQGDPIVVSAADPHSIAVVDGTDALILFDGGYARWPASSAGVEPPAALPGSPIATVGVRLPEGWILFWAEETPGMTQLRLHTATLDASAAITSSAELDPTLVLGSGLPFTAARSGDGALLAMQGSMQTIGGVPILMTLAFDRFGAPSNAGGSLAWKRPLDLEPVSQFSLAGDDGGSWLAAMRSLDLPRPLLLSRLDEDGATAGLTAEVDVRPGFHRLDTASNGEGVAIAWSWRSSAGGPDLHALEGSFMTHAGAIVRPCD
jgi:hypothetical protein